MPPYTLRMHSTNSNQVLSLHTQNALNQLKSSALLTHSQCTQPTQMKIYNAGMWTHAHPMLRNTSKEHQSSTCAPPNSRWPPKPQSSSKALQNSSKAPKAPPTVLTYTSNTHKPSRSLSMHTSNQTSNDAICMSGPITCWKSEERLHIQKHIDHTSMWTMLGVRYPTLLQPCSLFPSLYHHIDKPYGINISLPPYSNMLVVLTYLKSTYVFDYLQH